MRWVRWFIKNERETAAWDPIALTGVVALTAVFGSFCAAPAFADQSDATGKRPSRKAIREVVLAYARSVGCAESVDSKNIVEVPDEYGLPWRGEFLVVYAVDVGCAGGSASWQSAFAVVQPSSSGRLYVDPELSRPEATIGFPQSIVGLTVREGRIVYTARQFDFSKDALCCPSVSVSGNVLLKKKYPDLGIEGLVIRYWQSEDLPAK